MPRSTLESEIRSRIEALATELAGMIRQEAIASVEAALGGDGAAPARRGRRRGPGRPRGSSTKKAASRRGPGRPKGSGRGPRRKAGRGRPGRPPSAAVTELTTKVLAQVKSKAGQGVAEIAKALKVGVDRVKPVMAKLLAGKQVKKTGQKRGTKYRAR